MRFWDSSAILPLIVEERTSDYATRYYEANPELVVWWGTSVECASALAPKAHRHASAITNTGTAAWTNLACAFLEVNVGHYII